MRLHFKSTQQKVPGGGPRYSRVYVLAFCYLHLCWPGQSCAGCLFLRQRHCMK